MEITMGRILDDCVEIVEMASEILWEDCKRIGKEVKKILNFEDTIKRNKMNDEHQESRDRMMNKLSEMDIGYYVDEDGVGIELTDRTREEKIKHFADDFHEGRDGDISYNRNRYGFPKDLNKYKKSDD